MLGNNANINGVTKLRTAIALRRVFFGVGREIQTEYMHLNRG